MGAMVIGICVANAAGCADPPSQGSRNPSKPVATARVTSSALTKKITGAKAWRIYEGRTQVVVMGFDAKGKPIDGIRFRYASKNSNRKWAASFESLRDGGVIQIGRDGKPTKQTMSDDGVKTLVGASRVLSAWMKKRSGGAVAPKALMSAAATVGECGGAAVNAVGDCAGLVAECASWGYAGWKRGRWLGAAGGALACLAYNYSQTAQCAGSAYDAGRTCYDAYQNQSPREENKNGEPNASSQNPNGSDPPSGSENPAGENPERSNPNESGSDPEAGSGDPEYTGEDAPSWQSEESNAEAEAAAEDPEAPLDEQVEESDGSSSDSESADESYDSNPSDPEEQAISDDSGESADSSEPEEQASSDDSASNDDSSNEVETEALPTVASAARHGACGTSRVLQCGARPATAFCRCVK